MRSKSIFFAVGCALFAIVLWRTGWQTISRSFTEIGFNYVWVILWPMVYYFFYSLGWKLIIPPDKRFPLWEVLKARIVGEAINYLTPLGNFGGEPARTLYLKEHMPLHVTAATVVIDRTLYFLATVVFTLAGVAVAFFTLKLDGAMKTAALVTLVGLSVVLIALIAAQQVKGVTKLANLFVKMGIGRKWLTARLHKIAEIEETMRDFYRKRPADFAGATLCHLLGRAGGTLEIWIVLYFLGAFSEYGAWQQSDAITSMTIGHQLLVSLLIAVYVIVLNTAFFMFPSQIGVAEGGTAVLFRLLGFDPALGVALQLVRRIKSLFYIGFGLQAIALKKKKTA